MNWYLTVLKNILYLAEEQDEKSIGCLRYSI